MITVLKLSQKMLSSPLKHSRYVLVNERLVVGLEGFNVWNFGALCVQVVFAVN